MWLLLSTYEWHGDIDPMVGLAVRLRALGAELPVCAPPAFADLPRRAAGLAAARFGTAAVRAAGVWR